MQLVFLYEDLPEPEPRIDTGTVTADDAAALIREAVVPERSDR